MFDAIQDRRGVMYFANFWNIRMYDGVKWDYVSMSNQRGAFSFGMDERGVVYVGGHDDLGYLEPDEQGQIQFISLASELPVNRRKFNIVYKILVKNNHVYFASESQIMRWDGKKLHIWALRNTFHGFFEFNKEVYVNIRGLGLHKVESDDLKLLKGGNSFSEIGIVQGFQMKEDFVLVSQNKELSNWLRMVLAFLLWNLEILCKTFSNPTKSCQPKKWMECWRSERLTQELPSQMQS